jgi:hypothetical protein
MFAVTTARQTAVPPLGADQKHLPSSATVQVPTANDPQVAA